MYINLKIAMREANITNSSLAKILGITDKTVYNKIIGLSDWTWTEAKQISSLFPKYTMEWLFSAEEKSA